MPGRGRGWRSPEGCPLQRKTKNTKISTINSGNSGNIEFYEEGTHLHDSQMLSSCFLVVLQQNLGTLGSFFEALHVVVLVLQQALVAHEVLTSCTEQLQRSLVHGAHDAGVEL